MTGSDMAETDIAIIGMAGHFPGAPDVDVLWERVARGDDCLTDLDPAELIRAGVPSRVVRGGEYVLRTGRIDGVDEFDPEFFGIGRRDAAVMDPQHRHFIECAWEALESAAHTPERFDGSIGVFAGSGMNTYLLHNLLTNPSLVEQLGWFLMRHTGNDKDFLTTTLSYRLDLRGPSVNVQTACSTSLVAVHLAAQSLLAFECDLALAGGVTIEFPHARGYQYREGEILSPNGRCRAFDAASDGTVLTSGAAVVALRRLADAVCGRRPDPRRHQGFGGEQRRQPQGQLPGPERRRPRRRGEGGARRLRHRPAHHRAARSARHRHRGGRPDRGRGAHRGVPQRHHGRGLLPARFHQAQHRPPRHRRGHGQPRQGRAGAATRHAAAARQPHRAQPPARPRTVTVHACRAPPHRGMPTGPAAPG